MRKLFLMSLTLMLVLPAAAMAANVQWQRASNGRVPGSAIAVGNDINGEPLYVCRGFVSGSVQPGKIRRSFDGCHIPFNNQEMTVNSYEVMVDGFGGGWRRDR